MAATFENFCWRYGLDPSSDGAKRDFKAYLFNLRLFQGIIKREHKNEGGKHHGLYIETARTMGN